MTTAEPRTTLQRLTLEQVTPTVLDELEPMYARAYRDCRMHEEFSGDVARFRGRPGSVEADLFRFFIVREADSGRIVGARAIELLDYSASDHAGFAPVYGKRFSVLPEFRGRGVGAQLVAEGKKYCFDERDIEAIFGSSGELGALSMYGRNGAMYHLGSIEQHSEQNTPEQNRFFFAKYITDPAFRPLRTPSKRDVRFAYPRDESVAAHLREHGYLFRDEFLATVPSTAPQAA